VSVLAWRSPTDPEGEATSQVAVGDMIRTGENFHPHYQVIAMTEDRAWIRDTQHGTDHVVPIDRCRRI
jgi:hypothetical protein